MSRATRHLRSRLLNPGAVRPALRVISVSVQAGSNALWTFNRAFSTVPSNVADLAALTVNAGAPTILNGSSSNTLLLEYTSTTAGDPWAVAAGSTLNNAFGGVALPAQSGTI